MDNKFEYDLRTVLGFLVLIAGIVLGLWLAWWLNFRGNVIEILHAVKMSLPGWTWTLMRYFFSLAFGAVFMSVFIGIAMLILRGKRI